VWMAEKEKKDCYNCYRLIPADARYCPFCGFDQVEKSGFILKTTKDSTAGSSSTSQEVPPQQASTHYVVSQQWMEPGTGTSGYGEEPFRYVTREERMLTWTDVAKLVGSIGTVIFLIMLLLEFGYAIAGLRMLPQMASFPYAYPFYFITPFVVGIYAIQGIGYAVIYVLFLLIALIAFVSVLRGSRNFTKELTLRNNRVEGSTLFLISSLLMTYMFVSLAVVFILEAIGQSPSAPNFSSNPVYMNYFLFLFAPVWEEIAARVLLIGLPLLIIASLRHTKDRPSWRYLYGGNLPMTPAAVFFLIVSSVMFGLGHWLAGSGWGFWKIFPASIAGLFLGYLFLKKGLFAAIIFHFGVDAEELLLLSNSNAAAIFSAFAIVVWALIGFMFFIYYILLMMSFLSSRSLLPEKVRERYVAHTTTAQASPASATVSSAQGGQQEHVPLRPYEEGRYTRINHDETIFGFVCSNCGSTEARYKDGTFICVHCGKETKK